MPQEASLELARLESEHLKELQQARLYETVIYQQSSLSKYISDQDNIEKSFSLLFRKKKL